jgi:WS/DGAT/MGAT family acyltransferase
MWMIEGLEDNRFALITKTHHALIDGIAGVDLATVLFDLEPVPKPNEPEADEEWVAAREPSGVEMVAAGVRGIVKAGVDVAGRAVSAATHPETAINRAREAIEGVGEVAWAGLNPAPHTPLNVEIGPHRRIGIVRFELEEFKQVKDALGGTVNDVVLSAVSLALGRFLRRRGHDVAELELKAMVPVSVRADADRGALGNQVATMYAPLPVGVEDPVETFRIVHGAMGRLKDSGQAVGAQVLTELSGFAPPTIMAQAARLTARQRFFNLVVTNVPGPQFPLYLMGRRLRALYPQVPLAAGQAVGIAIMSYDGQLHFGLLGDFDSLPDLEALGTDLHAAIEELGLAAGVEPPGEGDGRPPLGFEMPSTRAGRPRAAR